MANNIIAINLLAFALKKLSPIYFVNVMIVSVMMVHSQIEFKKTAIKIKLNFQLRTKLNRLWTKIA